MKDKNCKTAHTIAELFLVMLIWGSLATLVLGVFHGANDYIEKIKQYNILLELKRVVNALTTNVAYYSDDSDFSNLRRVVVDEIKYEDVSKFKNLMLKELDVKVGGNNNSISCFMMLTNAGSTSDTKVSTGNCYQGSNSAIWCIPDTDFKEKNMVLAKNASGSLYKYVPITVYPDLKHISSEYDFKKYALVFGVRRDGDITLINSVDCSLKEYKNYAQCKLNETIDKKKEGVK